MSIAKDAELAPQSSTRLWSSPIATLPSGPGEAFLDASLAAAPFAAESFASASFADDAGQGAPERRVRRSTAFLTEPKRCALAEPGLKSRVVGQGESLSLSIRAEAPAFFVAPTAEGIAGRFEDSGFPLAAKEERVLRFIPAEGSPAPTAAELEKALRIYDLRSSYE